MEEEKLRAVAQYSTLIHREREEIEKPDTALPKDLEKAIRFGCRFSGSTVSRLYFRPEIFVNGLGTVLMINRRLPRVG